MMEPRHKFWKGKLPPLLESLELKHVDYRITLLRRKWNFRKISWEFPLWPSGNESDYYPEDSVRSLALLSGLRIWCCWELWRGLQTRLASCVAVAVAMAAAVPIRPLTWELPYTAGATKKTKERYPYTKSSSKDSLKGLSLIIFWSKHGFHEALGATSLPMAITPVQ